MCHGVYVYRRSQLQYGQSDAAVLERGIQYGRSLLEMSSNAIAKDGKGTVRAAKSDFMVVSERPSSDYGRWMELMLEH